MTMAAAPTSAARGAGSGRTRTWLLAGAAAVCLYYLAMELWTLGGGLGLPLDDSFIHLQFARNLAAGRGLSYNPGELVTGSTAPLWTALLALLAYLPGNAVAWAQLLGIVLYLAMVDATWRLARELGLSRGLAALGGALTLGTGWMAWSALSGMEVPLFALLSLWGIILHLRERGADLAALRGEPAAAGAGIAADGVTGAHGASEAHAAHAGSDAHAANSAGGAHASHAARGARGAVAAPPLAAAILALAALARPEGLLLLALSFADRCLLPGRAPRVLAETAEPGAGAEMAASGERDSGPLVWHRPALRRLAAAALLAACVLAGPLLFYRLAGGSFLPTTFGAKGGHLRGWLPNLQYVDTVVAIFLRPQPFMTLLAGGGVAALVARLGSRRDRGLLPALWVVVLPLLYSTISPGGAKVLVGNFGRYYFPLFPLVILLGLLGLEGAAAALRPAGLLRAVLVALLVAPTLFDLWVHAGLYTFNLANVEASDVRAARWLAPRLPAGAVLAVNDIGVFKFLLPNRVLDLAGIANPELSREVASLTAGGMPFERAMAVAVAARHPDYIAIFPAWLPHLPEILDLKPLLRLRIEHNITMGANELVIYGTPWTRFPLKRLAGDN